MQSEIRIAKEGAFVREKPPSKLPIRTIQKNLPVGGFSGRLSLHPNHVSVTYKAPLPTSRHQVKSPLSGKQRSAFSAVRSRRQRSASPAPHGEQRSAFPGGRLSLHPIRVSVAYRTQPPASRDQVSTTSEQSPPLPASPSPFKGTKFHSLPHGFCVIRRLSTPQNKTPCQEDFSVLY